MKKKLRAKVAPFLYKAGSGVVDVVLAINRGRVVRGASGAAFSVTHSIAHSSAPPSLPPWVATEY